MEDKNINIMGFVPFRLAVEDRPELNFFPLNILFAKMKVENGKTIMGSALYEPDITSFKIIDKTMSMIYINKYGGNSFVEISFYNDDDKNTFQYKAEKFVNDNLIGTTHGPISSLKDEHGWSMFFSHLTAMGLTNGEQCVFEDVTHKQE